MKKFEVDPFSSIDIGATMTEVLDKEKEKEKQEEKKRTRNIFFIVVFTAALSVIGLTRSKDE